MIYLYGDSHARFSFNNLRLEHRNLYQVAVTMHRIGRDGLVPNYGVSFFDEDSIFVFAFGEVDCRCHVMRQVLLGRNEDEVISELVKNYLNTIKKATSIPLKAVIITGVIPPTEKEDYESINGPIKHEFPFVGTDEERARFTQKMNILLEKGCKEFSFIYFYPYKNYIRENGCLKYELSDRCVHVGDTRMVLEEFETLINTL